MKTRTIATAAAVIALVALVGLIIHAMIPTPPAHSRRAERDGQE